MDDERIVELYWKRDESAINETDNKYGRYCYSIAYNILRDRGDAEECRNDTYLAAWNNIPPSRPRILSAFLGAITRRISIDRVRYRKAEKRGGGEAVLSMSELDECIPDGKSIDDELDSQRLSEIISGFLRSLPDTECDVFMRRYWYFDSIEEICDRYGFGKSKVKTMLMRTRRKLLHALEKEGIFV